MDSLSHDFRQRGRDLWQDRARLSRSILGNAIFQNAASLYLIQFAQYILPLITVPYLVRVLGPTGYGTVAFGQSLARYFLVLTEYGFAYSATRSISVNREDLETVSRIASNVWAAKALICTLGFVILLMASTYIPKLYTERLLLIILYGTVIGNVLFPIWLFQGMEKMVFISAINLVMQLLVMVGIFALVHQPEDYLLYAGIMSAGFIGAGVAGLGIALFTLRLRPVFPSRRGVLEALVDGWMVFLSRSSVSLYTVGNAFILGLLTNNTVVGYYSAAEKVVTAGSAGIFAPITSAAFPRFSKFALESKEEALKWAGRMSVLLSSLGLILSAVMVVGAPAIVGTLLGSEYDQSIPVMRILAMLCLPLSISYVLGFQIMLPFGKDKAFAAIPLAAGLVNITLAFVLVPVWGPNGMAVAYLLSEALVAVTIFIYLWLHRLNPWREVLQGWASRG